MRIYGGMEDTKKPDAGGLDSLEPDKWGGGEIRDGWMEEAGDSSWMGGVNLAKEFDWTEVWIWPG